MYPTTDGNRALQGIEAQAFRTAAAQLLRDMEKEDFLSGTEIFDRLDPDERLIMLASVIEPLLVAEAKAPAKTCISDATIAAIYSHAEDMVWQEIDAGTVKFRGLIAQVIPELAPRPQCTRPFSWLRYIDSLLDCVLDDRDYLLEEDIVDAAPEQAMKLREALGIEDDYFTHTAPNPTEERVHNARQTLTRILGASWEE